jgi:sorting nexin-1/2
MDVEESPWADSSQNTNLPSQSDDPSSPPSSSASHLGAPTSSSRPTRGPRRMVAQPTRLEAVDDPLGPLSAASDNDAVATEAPPAPPQKEQLPIRTTMSPQSQTRRPTDPHHIDYDDTESPSRGPRPPPPVDAARPSSVRSSTQPSVSVERASKPTFNISVGDPVKIGDLTSSHIVYSVRTKVSSRNSVGNSVSMANNGRRPLLAHTSNQNLKSSADTAIFYGSTIRCMETTLAALSHLHQRSKPSDDSTPTLLKPDERHWRRCSTRLPHTLRCNMMQI